VNLKGYALFSFCLATSAKVLELGHFSSSVYVCVVVESSCFRYLYNIMYKLSARYLFGRVPG